MFKTLPPLNWAYVAMIIVWCVYYLVRLIDHSRNHVFLKQPWLLLWLCGYVFGFSYIVNNYSVQAHLEVNLFPYTDFPMVIILKLSLFTAVYLLFLTGIRFYSPYEVPLYSELVLLICYAVSCGIVVMLLSQDATYPVLYWSSNLLVCTTAFIALGLLVPILRQFVRTDFATIEQIHFIWFGVCVSFAAIGAIFNTVSAIDGLLSNRANIVDMAQHIAYVANSLSLVSMMILNSPDQLIYLTGLPIQQRKLHQLDQLRQYILLSTTIEEKYPLSAVSSIRDIERAIYEEVVSIFDLYPYLDSESALYKVIADIEFQATSYHECLELLSQVSIPKSS